MVSAERVRVEVQARRVLADLDAAPIGDPLTELLKLAGEMRAFADAAAHLVNGLDEIRYESRAGTEQLRAEVGLYERASMRLVNVLVALVRLRVEERLVRVEEKQADLIVSAVEAGFAAIGLSREDALMAKQVIARHLRALPPGGDPEGDASA